MFILQNSSMGLHFDQTANGDAWLIGEQLFTDRKETKLIRASW